jgi:hypothetical protein
VGYETSIYLPPAFLLPALLACVPFNSSAQIPAAQPMNRIVGPVSDGSLVVLKGNVHPLARPEFDRGAAPATTPTGRIPLALRRNNAQQQALAQFLSDVQNPASASLSILGSGNLRGNQPGQAEKPEGARQQVFRIAQTAAITHG